MTLAGMPVLKYASECPKTALRYLKRYLCLAKRAFRAPFPHLKNCYFRNHQTFNHFPIHPTCIQLRLSHSPVTTSFVHSVFWRAFRQGVSKTFSEYCVDTGSIGAPLHSSDSSTYFFPQSSNTIS